MNQIPNIGEPHNTREVEEIVKQFEKRMPLITSHGLLLEARLTPTSYLKMKEWLRTTLLSQQQKYREELQKAVQEEKLKHCCCLIEDSKVIESCKLHGDELKKAREDMLHTLDSSIDNVTYAPKKPSDYKAWQDGFMEAYQQARKLIKRSELDTTSPVYKFFTASEEVRRPAIEEALKKASQEQSELDQDVSK